MRRRPLVAASAPLRPDPADRRWRTARTAPPCPRALEPLPLPRTASSADCARRWNCSRAKTSNRLTTDSMASTANRSKTPCPELLALLVLKPDLHGECLTRGADRLERVDGGRSWPAYRTEGCGGVDRVVVGARRTLDHALYLLFDDLRKLADRRRRTGRVAHLNAEKRSRPGRLGSAERL